MDITKLRPIRISPLAKDKVILDFFGEFLDPELFENSEQLDYKIADLHAGALCLYATTLITKLHETNPFSLEPYYNEREESLYALAKSSTKYAGCSNEEVRNAVKDMIARDIRNSFAHGNFDISYDIYTKKLYYVLHPQRKDFKTDEPIVISKTSLLNANKRFIQEKGEHYSMLPSIMLKKEVTTNLSNTLKGFILPTQMLKLSDYYLGKAQSKGNVKFDYKIYPLIQYALSATKITYEQDDYYNIFGHKSNIFNTISLIRNSIAHDTFEFTDNAFQISYTDKDRTLSEPLMDSATKLYIIDSQKEVIKRLQSKYSPESVGKLSEKFKEIYNFFFIENNIKDIAQAYEEEPESE